jgi:hypothetical protein
MKPPEKPPGFEDDRRHTQLGRIVRKGLERTYGVAPEPTAAEQLYRQAVVARRPTSARAWPLFLGGFGAVCAAAALLLAWLGPAADKPLVWVSELTGPGNAAGTSATQVGHVDSADMIRFSDGSAVTFRPRAWGRIVGTSARAAQVELGEGRANFQVKAPRGSSWKIQAGPYLVEAQGAVTTAAAPGASGRGAPDTHGAEFEAAWTARQQILSIGLFAGKLVVHGPGAPSGRTLHPGESLLARARDGLVRVGSGRVLLADLSHEEAVEGVGRALLAEPEPDEASKAGGLAAAELIPAPNSLNRAPDENGVCVASEPLGAASVPDPGPVSLATCRHADPGPTGKDVVARLAGEPWVRPGPGGCLHYAEDARGNRVPDFSSAGYHGGGIILPSVAAPSDVAPLLPGSSGDDTPAIQAALDAIGALPVDAQGFRGAVELGPGVFTLKTPLNLVRSGVVLRGQGTEGPDATVLRGVGTPHDLIRIGPRGRRRPGREVFQVADVYVPVGARSFTLEKVGGLQVGDDIIVYRPKTQRWICAIGTDVMPARVDGLANPPWRPSGSLSFERRITKIEGNRITVDVPLTNALEKEYTQAFITEMEFPDRVSEIGVENLTGRGDYLPAGHCPPARGRLIRADTVVNGWVRHVRGENLGGEVVSLGSGSKWMSIEDATYVGSEQVCTTQTAFTIGGQQNLVLRARSLGSHLTALMTETEVEGPNAVVDMVAIGKDVRVRVAPRWTTGLLLDNLRLQDGSGMPSGEIDLARAGATYGWSAANSVLWNSDAEALSVDSPPTAHNWIMGGARGAKSMVGTGVYSAPRSALQPTSLYRAQLVERLGRSALSALGRSAMGTLSGVMGSNGGNGVNGLTDTTNAATGTGLGNAGAGNVTALPTPR